MVFTASFSIRNHVVILTRRPRLWQCSRFYTCFRKELLETVAATTSQQRRREQLNDWVTRLNRLSYVYSSHQLDVIDIDVGSCVTCGRNKRTQREPVSARETHHHVDTVTSRDDDSALDNDDDVTLGSNDVTQGVCGDDEVTPETLVSNAIDNYCGCPDSSAPAVSHHVTIRQPCVHCPFGFDSNFLQELRYIATMCFTERCFGDIKETSSLHRHTELFLLAPKVSACDNKNTCDSDKRIDEIDHQVPNSTLNGNNDVSLIAALFLLRHYYALDVIAVRDVIVAQYVGADRQSLWCALLLCSQGT